MADETDDGTNPSDPEQTEGGNIIDLAVQTAARKTTRRSRKANGHAPPKEPPKFEVHEGWQAGLITVGGKPAPNLANTIIALEQAPQFAGKLAYDQFAAKSHIKTPLPWGSTGHWSDADDVELANWLQHNAIGVEARTAAQGAEAVARRNPFHPVQDYLNALEWDKTLRIDAWLTYYLGVQDTAYSRAVGRKWLISAVTRIMLPGCQADYCLILEGPQGKMKSSALRALGSPWFTDDLGALHSKDAQMQLHGNWIVEIAELDRMSVSEVATVKAFLTRRIDNFRPPYGRRTQDFPRSSIFAATVNLSTFLQDETGGRRFWPVIVENIDLETLKADKDQIWAEAMQAYKSGEPWYLEGDELLTAAKEEQELRYIQDSWEEAIRDKISALSIISLSGVYDLLDIVVGKRDGKSDRRVGKAMKRLGWIKKKVKGGTDSSYKYFKIGSTIEEDARTAIERYQ